MAGATRRHRARGGRQAQQQGHGARSVEPPALRFTYKALHNTEYMQSFRIMYDVVLLYMQIPYCVLLYMQSDVLIACAGLTQDGWISVRSWPPSILVSQLRFIPSTYCTI